MPDEKHWKISAAETVNDAWGMCVPPRLGLQPSANGWGLRYGNGAGPGGFGAPSVPSTSGRAAPEPEVEVLTICHRRDEGSGCARPEVEGPLINANLTISGPTRGLQ